MKIVPEEQNHTNNNTNMDNNENKKNAKSADKYTITMTYNIIRNFSHTGQEFQWSALKRQTITNLFVG